jgi:hypothetical protein
VRLAVKSYGDGDNNSYGDGDNNNKGTLNLSSQYNIQTSKKESYDTYIRPAQLSPSVGLHAKSLPHTVFRFGCIILSVLSFLYVRFLA